MPRTNRTWHIISPVDGQTHVVHDLKEFCDDNNLKYATMYRVMCDETKGSSCEGFYPAPEHDTAVSVSKDTTRYTLFNEGLGLCTSHSTCRATLAEESGISTQSVWRMMTGKAVSVRGWRITDDINDPALGNLKTEEPVAASPINDEYDATPDETTDVLDVPKSMMDAIDEALLPGEEDI